MQAQNQELGIDLLRSDPNKSIQSGQQTDIQFAEDVMDILEIKLLKEDEDSETQGEDFDLSVEDFQKIERLAQLHSDANIFNKNSSEKFQKVQPIEDRCECGCKRARGESLSLFENEQDSHYLGPGIVLFFRYLRSVILLLLLIVVVYGIYGVTVNVEQGIESNELTEKCSDSFQFLKWFCLIKANTQISARNVPNSELMISQLILAIVASLLLTLGLDFIKLQGRSMNIKLDKLLDTSSDFCIQIDNLPNGNYTEKEVVDFIESLYRKIDKTHCKIDSVQVVYDMSEFRKMLGNFQGMIVEIGELLEEKKVEQNLNQNSQQKPKEKNIDETKSSFWIKDGQQSVYKQLKEKIFSEYSQIKQFRHRFLSDAQFRKGKASSTCLVEFSKNEEQMKFLEKYGRFRVSVMRKLMQRLMGVFGCQRQGSISMKGNLLRITRAPEPSDINWQNSEVESKQWRTAVVWLITLVIIGVSFGMLVLVSEIRKRVSALKDFSILVVFSLQLFNRLIWIVLVSVIDIEQNNTKSDAVASVMQKASFAQLINVVALPIIMNLGMKENFSGPSGLSGLVFDFQIIVFGMMVVWNLINPLYQLKKIQLCIPYFRNKIISQLSNISSPQYGCKQIKGVLQFYERPAFPKAGVYVFFITIVTQALFFSFIQPTLLIVVVISLFLFLLINKYLIFYRCKIPPLTDSFVFEEALKISHFIPLYFGIGTMFFVVYLGHTEPVELALSIILVLVGLLGLLDPFKMFTNLVKYLFFKQQLQQHFQEESDEQKQKQDKRVLNDSFEALKSHEIQVQSTFKQETSTKINPSESLMSKLVPEDLGQNSKGKNESGGEGKIKVNNFIEFLADKDNLKLITPLERRESYYQLCNLNKMFYFEKDFVKACFSFNRQLKDFCEQFSNHRIDLGSEKTKRQESLHKRRNESERKHKERMLKALKKTNRFLRY